jgi:transcriptional regulator with XRE-family HTH domain
MSFQENLKRIREEHGYKTAKEFADTIPGLNYATYSTYENVAPGKGREPKYDLLCQIAAALGVTTDELLGYSPSEFNKYVYMLKELCIVVTLSADGKVILSATDDASDESICYFFNRTENIYLPSKDSFIEIMRTIIADTEEVTKPLKKLAFSNLLFDHLLPLFSKVHPDIPVDNDLSKANSEDLIIPDYDSKNNR